MTLILSMNIEKSIRLSNQFNIMFVRKINLVTLKIFIIINNKKKI